MANVFARESAHMVKLTLTPSGEAAMGRVAVSAVSAETGDPQDGGSRNRQRGGCRHRR